MTLFFFPKRVSFDHDLTSLVPLKVRNKLVLLLLAEKYLSHESRHPESLDEFNYIHLLVHTFLGLFIKFLRYFISTLETARNDTKMFQNE